MSGLGGFAHLDPVGAGAMAKRVEDDGEQLRSFWKTDRGEIDIGESGIALDRLGVAFLPGYLPTADAVRTAAAQLPDKHGELAAAGKDSVAYYLRGDYDSARRFPR